jgi:hypothetical protein
MCVIHLLLLLRTFAAFHITLLTLTAGVLAGAVWLAAAGVPMALCLLIVMVAPAVTVLGYELAGRRQRV